MYNTNIYYYLFISFWREKVGRWLWCALIGSAVTDSGLCSAALFHKLYLISCLSQLSPGPIGSESWVTVPIWGHFQGTDEVNAN